jgi:hypothetical protein
VDHRLSNCTTAVALLWPLAGWADTTGNALPDLGNKKSGSREEIACGLYVLGDLGMYSTMISSPLERRWTFHTG